MGPFTSLALICIALAWGSPYAAGPLPISVSETLPASFKLDGMILQYEWRDAPSLVLDASSQVAGPDRAGDARDIEGQFWIAMDSDALVIAGKISDDQVRFPHGDYALLASDHLEVWLAFEPAHLANPSSRLDETDWCKHVAEYLFGSVLKFPDPQEECARWLESQHQRRRDLRRLFTHQYVLSNRGVREMYLGERQFPEIRRDIVERPEIVFGHMTGGYSFEARIPASAWPASSTHPIRDFRLTIDLVDNDLGHARQETFLSSSGVRKFGRPRTFNPVHLEKGIQFASPLDNLTAVTEGRNDVFFLPRTDGPIVEALGWIAVNDWGRRSFPIDGPQLLPIPLDAREPLAEHGATTVRLMPAGAVDGRIELGLGAYRDGKLQQRMELKRDGWCAYARGELSTQTRLHGDELMLALFCGGTQSFYGTGQCGSCPTVDVEVFSIDSSGAIERLVREKLPKGAIGVPPTLIDLGDPPAQFDVDPEADFGLYWELPGAEVPTVITHWYVWDPEGETYTVRSDTVPWREP